MRVKDSLAMEYWLEMKCPVCGEKYNKLDNEWIPDEVKTFLTHSVEYLAPIAEQALALSTHYAEELGQTEDLQSVFLRSLEAFDIHLLARVTRAKQFESK